MNFEKKLLSLLILLLLLLLCQSIYDKGSYDDFSLIVGNFRWITQMSDASYEESLENELRNKPVNLLNVWCEERFL